jgi:hypothetical protein
LQAQNENVEHETIVLVLLEDEDGPDVREYAASPSEEVNCRKSECQGKHEVSIRAMHLPPVPIKEGSFITLTGGKESSATNILGVSFLAPQPKTMNVQNNIMEKPCQA